MTITKVLSVLAFGVAAAFGSSAKAEPQPGGIVMFGDSTTAPRGSLVVYATRVEKALHRLSIRKSQPPLALNCPRLNGIQIEGRLASWALFELRNSGLFVARSTLWRTLPSGDRFIRTP